VESILFGHERGSFTGATDKHLGKFQEANGGTLFLDEVGELKLDMQVKLLRALQDGEIDPVGAKRSVKVDVRIISATNCDLAEKTRDGQFREDLYYRLNVFPVFIPPLRERREDIAALAQYFVTRFASEEHKPIGGITPEAMQMIEAYGWPGNVRQLENTVFRAVVLCDSDALDVNDFPQIANAMGVSLKERKLTGMPLAPSLRSSALPSSPAYSLSATDASNHMRKLEELEAEIIRMAITRYDGRMSEVARRLGIGRSTLYRKLKELGLGDVDAAPEAGELPEAKVVAGH
jgi:DNA-binding NtrC family response regulator